MIRAIASARAMEARARPKRDRGTLALFRARLRATHHSGTRLVWLRGDESDGFLWVMMCVCVCATCGKTMLRSCGMREECDRDEWAATH